MRRLWVVLVLAALAASEAGRPPVRGLVVDASGRPVRGATVTLTSLDGGCLVVREHSFLTAATGEGGEFVLPATPVPMEVRVEHPDHPPAFAAAGEAVVVRLQEGAYLEGTVSAPARIRAAAGPRPIASVDADGPFRLGPLPAHQEIALSVMSGAHRPFRQRFVLQEGETRSLEIRLDEGLAVRGRVVPARAGVVLRASQGEARESTATTAADGTFALTGLTSGDVCIVVLAPDAEPRIVTCTAGGGVEVRLDR